MFHHSVSRYPVKLIGLRLSLGYEAKSEKSNKPTDVVENLNQIPNEDVLPQE
jgi:hypothetical protein